MLESWAVPEPAEVCLMAQLFGTGYARKRVFRKQLTQAMRTFLRHIATGHYFQSLEKWTIDPDEAFDFGLASNALKVAHKLRIRDLELVLKFDDPDHVTATPFEKFLSGLSHNRRHLVGGRRGSRSAALA